MNKYFEAKCPNCGAAMIIKENCIECNFCGTQLVQFYDGSVDSDIALNDINLLLKEIQENKKEIFIKNGKVLLGNVDDIIANSKLKIATEELKKGKFTSAKRYAQELSGIEARRIAFLADFSCKNESSLQEQSIWANLTSSEIPKELLESEVYGNFYTYLQKFCKERESAAYESNAIIKDFIFKYLFLDKKVKAISGKDIYKSLENKANIICKKYPIFPEPWLALKLFDSEAIHKMIRVFETQCFPYKYLINWSNNHFVSRFIDLSDQCYEFRPIFTKEEMECFKAEIARRYPDFDSRDIANPMSLNVNVLVKAKSDKALVGNVENSFLYYPKELSEVTKRIVNSFIKEVNFHRASGRDNCWAYAFEESFRNDWGKVYWFPTKNSKKRLRGNYDNYGLRFNVSVRESLKDALLERVLERFEAERLNFSSYKFSIDSLSSDLTPCTWLTKKNAIAQVLKITAWW